MKEQAKDIEGHYERADNDIKYLEDLFKKEENKIIMEEVRFKMKQAEDTAKEYINLQNDHNDDRIDIDNLIVENKLLIDKVNDLIGKKEDSID